MRNSRWLRPAAAVAGWAAALAAGGCAAPDSAGGAAPAAGSLARAGADGPQPSQDPIARAAQQSFLAWADGLPEVSAMPPMTMAMEFAFSGRLDEFAGEDLEFDGRPAEAQDLTIHMVMRWSAEIQDLQRFRARVDLTMDMPALHEQSGGRPTVLGCDLVADGETLWVQPDWSQAWFMEELRGHGTGVENMVFTVRMDTLRELIEVLPLAVPEENRALAEQMLQCASNPACLARILARSARVQSYERRGDRIHCDIEVAPEDWGMALAGENDPMAALLSEGAWRYRVEFDAGTGAMLHTESASAAPGGSLSFQYRTDVAELDFPPERFRFELPATRKVLPVDVFMRPVIHQILMQSGQRMDPTEGDFEF